MSFSRSLKQKTAALWEKCYCHPFVQEIGSGSLDRESFKFYLIQDYLYLIEYARIHAAGALKSQTEKLMTDFTVVQYGILNTEMQLHRNYMKTFGITAREMEFATASLFNKAYTSNMLAVAQTGAAAEILAVVLPCAWTYFDFATRLKEEHGSSLEGNFYRSWIESYAGDDYRDSISWLFESLDESASGASETKQRELEEIFRSSVEFEYLFWDMAYKKQMSF